MVWWQDLLGRLGDLSRLFALAQQVRERLKRQAVVGRSADGTVVIRATGEGKVEEVRIDPAAQVDLERAVGDAVQNLLNGYTRLLEQLLREAGTVSGPQGSNPP